MAAPPQTPMAGGGSGSGNSIGTRMTTVAQTPLKTPLRTPLRTPGGGGIGEQTSHTPIISFATIEAHKENVQPLVQGRSAHALNNALSRRQAELKTQRSEFETLVQSRDNAESDDPLEAWTQYVKWCIDSYPSGQTSESELLLVLERCTRLFRQSTQYQNDSRYLRMWILYARNVDCPADVYNFLLANEIGTSLASLYEELAIVYESQSNFDKADETFRLGIHRSVQPIDRLKRRYTEFQSRIMSQEGRAEDGDRHAYKEALRAAMAKAQRSMLGTKVGATSMSANTVRGMGGQAGLATKVTTLSSSNNARRPAVFTDEDGEDVFARSKGARGGGAGWADIGTVASRKQEKGPEAKAWKGEVLPQRDGGPTPKRPAIAVYRDSDDEGQNDDSEEQGRTPGKVKLADVFSKAREPSETDKLRRNPFANYDDKDMKSQHDKVKVTATSVSAPIVTSTSSKSKKSSHSSSKASASASTKQERYAAPLALLYPGLDLEQAVRRTSRKQRSGEVCMEELYAERYTQASTSSLNADPWAHLDAQQGHWLPDLPKPVKSRPMKRDPTVTAFTRAAQDEVMNMFNGGMANSDEESSEDEQSNSEDDEDDEGDVQMSMLKENDVQPTPTPGPKFGAAAAQRHPLGHLPVLGASAQQPFEMNESSARGNVQGTPMRKPFGGDRKPLGVKAPFNGTTNADDMAIREQASRPQRVTGIFAEEENNDDEDEDSDDEEVEEAALARTSAHRQDEDEKLDYLNMPMRELAPLSPITEATEYTRGTRTPATTMRTRPSQGWTPAANSARGSYDDSAYGGGSLPRLSDPNEGELSTAYEIEASTVLSKAAHDDVEMAENENENSGLFPNPVCPVDADVIQTLLRRLPLPLESSDDYIDRTNEFSNQLPGLQKRAAQVAKRRSSGHTSAAASSAVATDGWTMRIGEHVFTVRHKLGEGGYGAVFLAEDRAFVTGKQRQVGGINGDASFANLNEFDDDDDDLDDADAEEPKLIAVKVETPPNRWEFYILGQLRARLTDSSRLSSIICARKFFCFRDESFLLLEYAEKGTLLEIVNNAVKAGVASSSALAAGGAFGGGSSGVGAGPQSVGVDEVLAMFFVIEVIKVVEALHAVDLLHGDIKIDNCLLRLDESRSTDEPWTHAYDRTGANGWAAKGITLIDFGRAIDLRQFPADQRFVADWTPEKHDMPQIHQGQSWRHEIDYFGLASVAYCLLFGKYIEVVPARSTDGDALHQQRQQFTIDKPLRRYWQVDIWTTLFRLCLNVADTDDASAQLADVRERMETWLEQNCFRAGKNLKGSLKKLELWSMKRTM